MFTILELIEYDARDLELITNADKRSFIAKKVESAGIPVGSQINHKACSECRGKCCSNEGCELLPCDVKDFSVESVNKLLETGMYTIGFRYLGKGLSFPVLQVKEVGQDGIKIVNTLFHNKCALLMDKEPYCPLDENDRPVVAQLLIPRCNKDKACKQLVDDKFYTEQWFYVIDVMSQVVNLLAKKSYQDVYVEVCKSDAKKIRARLEEINFKQMDERDAISVLLCLLSGETGAILYEIKLSLKDTDEDIKEINKLLKDVFPICPVDMAKIMLDLYPYRILLTDNIKILLSVSKKYAEEVIKNLYTFQKVFETIPEYEKLAVEIAESLKFFEFV
jgi:hypothetical protein